MLGDDSQGEQMALYQCMVPMGSVDPSAAMSTIREYGLPVPRPGEEAGWIEKNRDHLVAAGLAV
ncbi:hypothetical protein IU500_33500 [Nocardia terpenica]|nr:hypothetical protein [Nocardia terpenica]MBF6121780.1 hypothetical protein [Nocardia terpenica]